jgi:hypothetical protein
MHENPWHRLPEQPPFVLPEDKEAVLDFNKRASDKHKLYVYDILPEPFAGDPDAPVVLLLNNPGVKRDRLKYKKHPRFVARMRENLLHKPSDYPFVFFAPDIPAICHEWWNRKLKGLLEFSYICLAKSILAVDHFPYPSQGYPAGRFQLPSHTQDYSFNLVKKAIERKAIIVLMRGKKRWERDVPELTTYKRLCRVKNPRRATISPGNCDKLDEIRRAIEMNASPLPCAT